MLCRIVLFLVVFRLFWLILFVKMGNIFGNMIEMVRLFFEDMVDSEILMVIFVMS